MPATADGGWAKLWTQGMYLHHHGPLPAAATVKTTDMRMPHFNSSDDLFGLPTAVRRAIVLPPASRVLEVGDKKGVGAQVTDCTILSRPRLDGRATMLFDG